MIKHDASTDQQTTEPGSTMDEIRRIAREAGHRILDIYHGSDFRTEFKEDKSPLTEADRASHRHILSELNLHFPDIPVLSEEGKDIPYAERKDWGRFWLVDPLDGTKEFIKRNGEFTVNIALIRDGHPVVGVIYAPALDVLYWGEEGKGAFRQDQEGNPRPISVDATLLPSVIGVGSRSHASEEETAYAESVGSREKKSIGSSLKFCLVAEGAAHYYYRHGPTMEWDTAAGQAIVEAACGIVTGLAYNKPVLLNGPFLVRSTERLDAITGDS